MTEEELCTELMGSGSGEGFYKCLTLVPDFGAHPFFVFPMLIGILLGMVVMVIIVAATER